MNKLSVITTPRSFDSQTHISLMNLGFSPLSIEQISRFGISVQWISKKQLDLWLEYEGLSEEKKLKAKKKYPTAGVEILDSQDFHGLEALVILNKALTLGLWSSREYDDSGSGEYIDKYADPFSIDLPLLIKSDQPYEYTLGDLKNADLLNRMVETYYGMTSNPDRSDKGFKFVIVMRPEITDKLIFGKWKWVEVKVPKVKPGAKISGGKLENMVTLDSDLPKPNVKDIDQYSLSMVPIGLGTIFGEWDPKPSVPNREYGSVCTDPLEKPDYSDYFLETGKPNRPTQSSLTQGKNYSSGVVKVKQKNASPDKTIGEKPLTRKYKDPVSGLTYSLDIVGRTVYLNPDNGASIPVAKIAISVEPNILGQPVIVLQTIGFKSSVKLDLNLILDHIQTLLLGKHRVLGENRDRISGEGWSIPRFLDKAYHNLGYRLNSDGQWIDWLHNRDIPLWSRFEDEVTYVDDGRTYEDSSTFITPSENSYQIAKEVETKWQLQRVALTRQKQIDAARQNNDEVLQRDLIADLGYDLSGLTSKQLKNLKRKLKREGKIPTGEYKPEPVKPKVHKLY